MAPSVSVPVVPAVMFPAAVTWVEGVGGIWVPAGTMMSLSGPSVFTAPLTAAQPCSRIPSALTSRPLVSKLKAPARVYSGWDPLFRTKNPSPWIIRSVVRPVLCADPWPKFVVMAPNCTPSPTWAGLRPPRFWVGSPAERSVWLRVSWNVVSLLLKPVVLTLAMLFDTTSILVWCARSPVIPEKRERSTGPPVVGPWAGF